MTREERKAGLRWDGMRICENCLYARELTEEEEGRFKNWAYGDKPELFCTLASHKERRYPHGVPRWNSCFSHEYDDESVLLPKNPKWCQEGVNDLWPYERERAEKIREGQNQISMGEALGEALKEEALKDGVLKEDFPRGERLSGEPRTGAPGEGEEPS